jgi:hypothetical protein
MGMKALLKKLDMIIELLLKDREDREAEKEEKRRIETERLLVEYAKQKGKRQPTGGIWSGRNAQDKPINSGGELIPVHLSAADKELLRQFYDT